MATDAEAELLARCRRGEASAWDTLFDLHYAATGRFVFQIVPELTREDTEEICQETFLTVIQTLGAFRGASQFRTWLFRIAANKAHDSRQRQLAAKRGGGRTPVPLQVPDPETGQTLDPPSPLPEPDSALLAAERIAALRAALDRLGHPCQETIELRYFGELSYDEIAAVLRLKPKTVSSRLSRCLDRLERLLSPRLFRENSPPLSV